MRLSLTESDNTHNLVVAIREFLGTMEVSRSKIAENSIHMARNHKFFFDKDGSPKARGPAAEKVLMTFLEVDVQGSDYICRDLMDDLTAIEDGSDNLREFIGNAHQVTFTPAGVSIERNDSESQSSESPVSESPASEPAYVVALKHFREVLEDWEAFILDDQIDDAISDDDYL